MYKPEHSAATINPGSKETYMSQIKTVLITGANGGIGKKLRRRFSLLNFDMRLIDRNAGAAENDKEVLIADLSSYDATWVDRFTGVDTVSLPVCRE